jgi:hypothetical protein
MIRNSIKSEKLTVGKKIFVNVVTNAWRSSREFIISNIQLEHYDEKGIFTRSYGPYVDKLAADTRVKEYLEELGIHIKQIRELISKNEC